MRSGFRSRKFLNDFHNCGTGEIQHILLITEEVIYQYSYEFFGRYGMFHDPDAGILPLRDKDSCKIVASNSIDNQYNAWMLSCLGRGLRSPSALFH